MPQVIPFVVGFVQGAATAFGGTAALSVTASSATVAGYAAGSSAIAGFILKTGAVMAASAAASKIAMGDMGGEGSPSSLSNVMDPMPSSRTIYGKTKTGGVIVFAKATTGYTLPNNTTKKNQILHMVIELAGHPCESVDAIYLGNTNLNYTELTDVDNGEVLPNDDPTDDNGVTRYQPSGTPYDAHMAMKVYTGAQTQADADLVQATTIQNDADKWTTDHIGREKTYVYIRMHFKSELFRGIPQFTFEVTGKNTISFLGQSAGYTTNPIKCLYDYMTLSKERGGFGVDSSDIDNTAWQAAADRCDETVDVYADGTTQPRYFCGGIVSAGQEPHAIIKSLLDACAGVIEWVGGKWYVWAYNSSDISEAYTLTESELVDFPVWQLNQSAKDAVNSIKPVIRSSETAWQPSEVQSVEALRKIWGSTTGSTFNSTAHGLEVNDRVKFVYWDDTSNSIDNDQLPAGITEGRYYWVVSATTNAFSVSGSKGGSPITLGTNDDGLTALHDIYLSLDGERNSSEMVFTMVNDATMARRLAIINLRQARQEISGTLICKPGTEFACPADLFVGDTIRILNQELSFYEVVNSRSGSVSVSTDIVTLTSHGLNDGKAVTFDNASSGTGLASNRIYYVRDATVSTFKVCEYRGGPAIDIGASDFSVTINEVEGKLFRVVSYRPILNDGLFTIELGVRATATNIYDWTDDREIEPETTPGITVQSLYDVGNVTNFTANSGTAQLYIQKDGTVITRVKLSWDETDDEYVAASGQVDIEYKLSSETDWIKYPKVIGSATEAYLTDVIDGEDYDFRVRFRNAFGKEGDWATIDDHTVVGKEAAPDPPSNFTATYVDGSDRIDLQWTTPTDLDLSHTVIGRSVSVYQELWENYSGFEYDLYDNGINFPDGFSVRKTQFIDPAFAYSKIKLFSFGAGDTLRVQFVYTRTSGSQSEDPTVYGVNGTQRCTEVAEFTTPTPNLNQGYSQFIDLTVKSSSGTDANGDYVAGPCNGFVFANAAGDTLNFTVVYFNARTYPSYQTIAEVPIGTNRGQAATQEWTEALVLKSDAARTHYYEIYSVDTSGNISTKLRDDVRVTEWGRVQELETDVSGFTVNITWSDSGSGGNVILQVIGPNISEIYRVPESKTNYFIGRLTGNSTYTVRAWLERFFGGFPAVSREVYTTFDIGSTPVPASEPDYFYIRPNT
jgi:hypothetical protein